MVINIQDDILKLHALGLLDKLLIDKTTKKHILWATDTYSALGMGYGCREEITSDLITGINSNVIKTRARKEMEQQSERTRQHAEVFSPLWLCKKMNDYADEIWTETERSWMDYVDSKRMEITCGEAPYLVSRYDVETGEAVPIPERIGLLDRKLKAVNDNAQSEREWLKWAMRAFKATYGYDYQGDNVLISRVNLLMTFEEYLWERWKRKPTTAECKKLIIVVTWNLWQMDGLTGAIPCGIAEDDCQISLFDLLGETTEDSKKNASLRCLVHNWIDDSNVEFGALPTGGKQAMKFDFVIGNPPYQEDRQGDSNTATPIYHSFMTEAYKISDSTILITPARFLFNTGYTPKAWNQERLNDPHFKILKYIPDSSTVFQNVEIKGGVAISYRDVRKEFGAIEVFTIHPALNDIFHKVIKSDGFESITNVMVTSFAYHFTQTLYDENPELFGRASKGHDYDLQSNVYGTFPEIFFDEKPNNGKEYISILGRDGNRRCFKYIRRDYVTSVINLDKHKLFISKAFGTGQFGEILPDMILGRPAIGSTITFLSVGAFDTETEVISCERYLKSKFARTLLGVLKATQNGSKPCYRMIPLQDFTPASDIDWTKSIPEIDQQLYKKYGLDETEIQFIETHVKEMT